MSTAHRYWVIPDTDAAIGAAMRSAGAGIVPGGLATGQGAASNLALIKVRTEACGAPPEGVTCRDLDTWTAYQSGPAWVRHDPETTWTGTERAVLIPVSEGTAEHVAHLPGGWSACEYLDGQRLVRYTGTKPAALAAYPTLYAADVAALLGGV